MRQSIPFRKWFAFAGAIVLVGCARDPLERAAWQASRVGTAAGEGHGGRDAVGLEAGARVAERFYYVAKYQASLEQRRVAGATGRAVTRKLAARSSIRGSKTPRYLAVRTQSDRRAKTRTSVMLWDTQSQEIVGNVVYDLNESPPSRTIVNFETYSAQYIGSGG